MRNIAIWLFCISICQNVYAQSDGVFFTMKCNRSAREYQVVLTGKKVCLAVNPIISAKEFVAIDEIKELDDRVYFDLTLSVSGFQTLRKLTGSLPDSKLALVADGNVYFVFDLSDTGANRILRFVTQRKQYGQFSVFHGKLKALIEGTP